MWDKEPGFAADECNPSCNSSLSNYRVCTDNVTNKIYDEEAGNTITSIKCAVEVMRMFSSLQYDINKLNMNKLNSWSED